MMAKDKGKEDNGNSKLKRKGYEKELRKLQAELCHLQAWVKHKGLRVMVLFEGRDGAGKGGRLNGWLNVSYGAIAWLSGIGAPEGCVATCST